MLTGINCTLLRKNRTIMIIFWKRIDASLFIYQTNTHRQTVTTFFSSNPITLFTITNRCILFQRSLPRVPCFRTSKILYIPITFWCNETLMFLVTLIRSGVCSNLYSIFNEKEHVIQFGYEKTIRKISSICSLNQY